MHEASGEESATSSEDEIVAMARNNLKRSQEFMVQAATIFGMYYEKHFDKLPGRVEGESRIQWVRRTLSRDTSCYNMFTVERPLFKHLG